MSPNKWDQVLRQAGFDGAQTIYRDHNEPYQINANIISGVAEPSPSAPSQVTLLTRPNISASVRAVQGLLESKGLNADFCTLTQTPPPNQDIISLLDIDEPFLATSAEEELAPFLQFMTKLKSTQVLWVTRAAQVKSEDPRYALVTGLSRTLRSELSLPIATLELNSLDDKAFEAIWRVFLKLSRTRNAAGELDRDFEFALSDGLINVSRFHWISVPRELAETTHEKWPKNLEIRKRGLLQTLQWVQKSPTVLGPDEVEVDVRAVGMNFKVSLPGNSTLASGYEI